MATENPIQSPTGFTPTPTTRAPDTENSIKAQREYAKALMDQKYTPPNSKFPFYTWANGLDKLSASFFGGLEAKAADERERAMLDRDADLAVKGLRLPKTDDASATGKSSSSTADISGDFNPSYARTVAEIESSNNPNTPANSGGNRGLYQFGPAEEKMYGLNAKNWNDPNAQNAALAKEYADHSKLLKDKGLPVNEHSLYFVHQQGVAGAPALLNAPAETSAWRVVRPFYKSDAQAKSAIEGNIYPGFPKYGKPVDEITAGDFRNGWRDKFYRVRSRFGDVAPAEGSSAPSAVEAPGGTKASSSLSAPGLPADAMGYADEGLGGVDLDFTKKMAEANKPVRVASLTSTGPLPGDERGVVRPPASQTFNGAAGRTAQALPAEVPPPGVTGGSVGGLGAAAGRLVPPGPGTVRPAPTATPAPATATPAGTAGGGTAATGLPQFIKPTQEIPPDLEGQIRGMLSSGSATTRQAGNQLLKDWQDRINGVTQVERGGFIYSGNPYLGFKNTGIPAKPDLKNFDIDVNGLKIPRVGTPVYDSAGNLTGYRQLPLNRSGSGPRAAPEPERRSGVDIGKPGTPGTPEQMRNFIATQTKSQYPDFPATEDENSLIQYNAKRNAYEKSAEKFQTEADKISNSSYLANDRLSQLNVLSKVLDHVTTGKGTATLADLNAVAANILGTPDEMAVWRQVADKIASNQQVGDIRDTNVGQGVAVRQTEADAIRNSQFGLDKQIGANRAVVRMQQRALERELEHGAFADEYIRKHGRLDNGFYAARNKWFGDHPFMTADELKRHEDIIKGGERTPGSVLPPPGAPPSSGFKLNQTATNPKTGKTMIYTKDGWKDQ